MSRGGKKRADKKPGRNCKSWHSARNFSKMASGQVPNGNGTWVNASSARLDEQRDFFENVLPAQCSERTARNKFARENRGTVTGRRPAGMPMDEWLRTIASGGRRRQAPAETEAE